MNLFVYVGHEDATTFYRVDQPLAHLRKRIPDLQLFYAGKEVIKRHLGHIDLAFIQRPSGPEHVMLIRLCKDMGIPVWIDYDDNLLEVPPENPAYRLYSKKETRESIVECLKLSDVISVSTPQIFHDWKEHTSEQKFVTIPNAYNDFLFRETPVFKYKPIVFWRGTESHQKDLAEFGQQIVTVSRKYPYLLFNFMGYRPWFLLEHLGKNGLFTPPTDILEYHKVLRLVHPSFFIVPLIENKLNLCKSNIAWIEGTQAGAVTLAPDWPEWQRPGVVTYKGIMDFQDKLKSMIEMKPEQLEELHSHSWNFIVDNLRLSEINSLREQLIKSLLQR
jgi:hypothetical protein